MGCKPVSVADVARMHRSTKKRQSPRMMVLSASTGNGPSAAIKEEAFNSIVERLVRAGVDRRSIVVQPDGSRPNVSKAGPNSNGG